MGVLRPEVEAAAEKEKVGSRSCSSVEGSAKSSGLCSRVAWRVLLRFFWEDVVKASCLCSSKSARVGVSVVFVNWGCGNTEKAVDKASRVRSGRVQKLEAGMEAIVGMTAQQEQRRRVSSRVP